MHLPTQLEGLREVNHYLALYLIESEAFQKL